MSQQRTCARPTCNNIAKYGEEGYCEKHGYALGVVKPKVPSEPSRAIVNGLIKQGWSPFSIATCSGLSPVTIKQLIDGEYTKIRQSTHDALANVKMVMPNQPAWRAARRIRALRAAGFTVKEIREGAGIQTLTITSLTYDRYEQISHEVFGRVDEFYRRHELDPVSPEGPQVRKRRWPAPLDWDDIDDPDEVAVASRFFHSDGQCMRGHELYDFNQYKHEAGSKKPRCKSCVSAQNALRKWMPGYSEDDFQWLSDELLEIYGRSEIASPMSLIEGRLRDGRAA